MSEAEQFIRLFLCSFACVYALLGGMLLIGLIARRSHYGAGDLRWAIHRVANIVLTVVFFVFLAFTATYTVDRHGYTFGYTQNGLLGATFAATILATIVIAQIALPVWLRRMLR